MSYKPILTLCIKSLFKINNRPTANIFLIIASKGVIGKSEPKQPQFPEFPVKYI